MGPVATLRLAVAGLRFGPGARRLARRARTLGEAAFADVLDNLPAGERAGVLADCDRLAELGVSAVLLGCPGYPATLASLPEAPPCLLYRGAAGLLVRPAIGICGSRDASPEGLRAARACAEVAARRGLPVVSGYARGVDMASHESALRAGGATVIVLPEGIDRFQVKRGSFAEAWDPKRAVVVSQFAPHQPWSAAGAMTRNATIIGLSAGLVVVEARDTGGTLAAGRKALDLGRRVVALRLAEVPRGNEMLLARGATAASSRDELACQFDQIASDPSGAQLSLL